MNSYILEILYYYYSNLDEASFNKLDFNIILNNIIN